GANHDGDLARALALIDAAAAAGAGAVQFHSFRTERLPLPRVAAAVPGASTADAYAHLERLQLRTEWPAVLRHRVTARGALYLAPPSDEPRADLLAALGVAALAVAAADVANLPLLRVLGRFGRPILLETACAGRHVIDAALAAIGEGAGA